MIINKVNAARFLQLIFFYYKYIYQTMKTNKMRVSPTKKQMTNIILFSGLSYKKNHDRLP